MHRLDEADPTRRIGLAVGADHDGFVAHFDLVQRGTQIGGGISLPQTVVGARALASRAPERLVPPR